MSRYTELFWTTCEDDLDIPEGWTKMPVEAVFQKGSQVVLLGSPDETHNCDYMGCGSVGPHVLAYAEIVADCSEEGSMVSPSVHGPVKIANDAIGPLIWRETGIDND